ncbi:MAG: LysR family transcriptional regulator [Alphaproteobacteria bacterium]
MYRNLDMAALRSLVAIADTGGVTSAAAKLHLTQSAVSMQIKRMEMILDQSLMERVGRKVALSRDGEQLLGYARRMIAMNDEVWGRLTSPRFEGEIKFGLPYDIIYPYIPDILQRFKAAYPRVKIRLKSWNTKYLKKKFAESVPDIILTTELPRDGTGELLRTERLGWYSASKYGNNGLFRYHFTSHVFFAKPASPRLTLPGCLGNRHWTPRGFVTPTPPLSARILPLFAAFAAHSRLTGPRCRPRPVCPNCLNMGFFNMCVMTPTRWWQNSPR